MNSTESYQDAICPECGDVLTGPRQPGDDDKCAVSGQDVVLADTDEICVKVTTPEVVYYLKWRDGSYQLVATRISR